MFLWAPGPWVGRVAEGVTDDVQNPAAQLAGGRYSSIVPFPLSLLSYTSVRHLALVGKARNRNLADTKERLKRRKPSHKIANLGKRNGPRQLHLWKQFRSHGIEFRREGPPGTVTLTRAKSCTPRRKERLNRPRYFQSGTA